ncbi:MAG TPA: hypothetical protein PKM88_03420 [bacterium]|nr:hypothetical protein [bacterium]
MGLIDSGNLGGKLDLAQKMRAYTLQRRIRSSAFVFIVFAMLSFIPLLVLPAVATQGMGGAGWAQVLHAMLIRLSSDWMLLVVLLISVTNLLLLLGMVFMLYAVLNLLEHQ